jgi:hypothetical protein
MTVVIDGADHAAAMRQVGDAWSYLIDLEQVAIAINGLATTTGAPELTLSDQSNRLDQYH